MNILPLLLVIPLAGALLSLIFRDSRRAGIVGVATVIALIGVAVVIMEEAWQGEVIVVRIGDWPAGLGLGLAVDMLGSVMVLTTSVIGGLSIIYSLGELGGEGESPRLVTMMLFLLTGLMGVLMTTDLFNLFVFIELSSVAAYVLVAFLGGELEIEASLKYMILGTITGLLFLLGIALIYDQVGALNMGAVAQGLLETGIDNVVVEFSTLLIMIGVGLPAAIFPLHSWLADAHSRAPSAVSAMLSGASVQVAIYAMLRIFYQSLGLGSIGILELLPWAGLATALFGGLLALVQEDIKRLLAYTTVSSGGLSVLLLSMDSGFGFESLFMHLLNHATAKALLFLSAGALIHCLSTREVDKMRGAWKLSPWLCSAFLIGAVCDFGGPSLGFFGKAYMFLGLAREGWVLLLVTGLAVVLVAASYLRVIQVFFESGGPYDREVRGTPRAMVASISILVIVCILLGLSAWAIQIQARMAAAQIMDRLGMVAQMSVM